MEGVIRPQERVATALSRSFKSVLLILFLLSTIGLQAQQITSFTPNSGVFNGTVNMSIVGNGTNFYSAFPTIDSMYLRQGGEVLHATSIGATDAENAIGTFNLTSTLCGDYQLVVVTPIDGAIVANDVFTFTCNRATDSLALRDLHDAFVGGGHPGLFPVGTTIDNWTSLAGGRVDSIKLPDLQDFGPSVLPDNFSNLKEMVWLEMSKGDMPTVILKDLPNLVWLSLSYNNMTSLTLQGMVDLANIHVDFNQLTTIDLSGLTLSTFTAKSKHTWCFND